MESNLNRILKLSKKTNNSEVLNINGKIILNSRNPYYELNEEEIKEGIQLNVTKDDCLIELLFSSENDFEILDFKSIEKYKLSKKYTIIKIPKNKCTYEVYLTSENKKKLTQLKYGLNIKISKKNYFYNWYELNTVYKENQMYLPDSPYLYRDKINDDEFEIYEIILEKEQLDNEIYLSYHPQGYYQYLLKKIDEIKAKNIISNISSILQKFYIYKDIAKKPPEIPKLENYHHKPIDLFKNLSEISTKNRTYLGLFQDIDEVLTAVRDYHLNIRMINIENIFNIQKSSFCSPFELYIEVINDNEVVKMREYSYCLDNFKNKDIILKFLKEHSDFALKSINGTDPFDFIQNFGKHQKIKNRHAQFTENLNAVLSNCIVDIPFVHSDIIDIEYEFENGDIIKMDYHLLTTSSFTDVNQKEFEDYYDSLINKQSNMFLIPNILQAKIEYKKQKQILFKDTNEIKWDFETKDGYLKCRVDNISHYNVFLQTSFSFDSVDNAINVMKECSDLFYSNDYKIIGIENRNEGGTALLYQVWNQLIQQKTLGKSYFALVKNDKAYDYFRKTYQFSVLSNLETCKFIGSLEELGEITDNYGKSEIFQEDIKHNRTNIYELIDIAWRKRLEEIRVKNINNSNIKNPTDIIIYTNAFCFSACSGFVKAFQNTGGAIIVGFNGNPKIKGTNEFDGSQSISAVAEIKTEEYYELEKLGYHITGITFAESFDESYQNTNESPIPREYTVNLVDRRVPIYSKYSDDKYDLFISNAKRIFEEFETNCSLNNNKLLLDDETCTLENHKRGGHPCGTNGKWNLENCEAYYCDLGYYYDQFRKECVLDICTNRKNQKNIYSDEIPVNETREFSIQPNDELIFYLQKEKEILIIS